MADNDTVMEASPDAVETRGRRKTRIGIVSSDKMTKTIVVTVNSLVRHPIYARTLRQSKKFKAHDENGVAHVGDTVEIMETRPLSKDKCWRLLRVVERAR